MRQPTPFKKHPLTIATQACCYTILGGSPLAVAAPTGGAVVGGSGTISQSGTATTTTINQATQNLAPCGYLHKKISSGNCGPRPMDHKRQSPARA